MLKKSASVVLGSSKSSTYPKRVRLRFQLACGLAGQPFWASCEMYSCYPRSAYPLPCRWVHTQTGRPMKSRR